MTAGDPRNQRAYKTACHQCLALSDICHLCGHPGARTCDHIIGVAKWLKLYGTYEGVNHPSNLAPAHGQKGPFVNRCPTCGLVCNQNRGSKDLQKPQPRSRDW